MMMYRVVEEIYSEIPGTDNTYCVFESNSLEECEEYCKNHAQGYVTFTIEYLEMRPTWVPFRKK